MADFKPQGPQPPDYVIPTSQIGVVIYQEKNAVGIQFVDPNGKQVFVSLDGRMLSVLGQSLLETAARMPDVLKWKAVGLQR